MADIPLQVVVVAQNLRLRAQPSLDAFAPVVLPRGTSAELLSLDPPGWAQLRVQTDGQPRTGWCMRRMLDEALHAPMPDFPSAEGRMWDLVLYYTGRVGYQLGAKAASLNAQPPVIDCSGWVALLLTSAMEAQNTDAGEDIFDAADIAACNAWSDRIILEIEARTPVLVEGHGITVESLPRSATIGLDMGDFTWEKNAPRLRGINHIVQVVRRPADQAPFVSEARGPSGLGGVRLTPLADWLDGNARYIQAGKAWAVDPFAMADPFSDWVIRARADAGKLDMRQPTLQGPLIKPEGNGSKIVARWDGRAEHADEWTRCVLAALQDPSNLLLNITPQDITEFCPKFPEDLRKRAQFWVYLISSIAECESNLSPSERFTESFHDTAGNPVISAGLLQLSVGDAQIYGCTFANEQDVLDPPKNLQCGVRILQKLVSQDQVISGGSERGWLGAARYWSTLRPRQPRQSLETIKQWCSDLQL